MTDILAVFRSRNQAVDFYSKLRTQNVKCTLINTPKTANVGCGLSVKFVMSGINKAKKIIKYNNYTAFFGFYSLDDRFANGKIKRLGL